MNRRLQSLTEALAPKDMAIAVAVCLRKHVQAHDKTTETLGISAGRRRSKKKRAAPRESEASGDAGGGNGGFGGDDREELEEDEVQVRTLSQHSQSHIPGSCLMSWGIVYRRARAVVRTARGIMWLAVTNDIAVFERNSGFITIQWLRFCGTLLPFHKGCGAVARVETKRRFLA